MDVVATILKPVVEILMVPVKRHLNFFISCKKYMRDMGMKMRELSAKRLDVEEHMNRNKTSRLEVPAHARGWLEDVGKIEEKVKSVSGDVGHCFNFQTRHKLGRTAFKLIEEIDSVIRTHSGFTWTDQPVPLGKVDSIKASISMPPTDHPDDFHSRERTFTEALKALKPQHQKSHMIALCGMGGVGKTTMMQRLKKAAKETKMFEYIVEAAVGEKTDPIAIQEAVANYLSIKLEETTKPARAERLRKWFEAKSDGGKTKFFIVLDDVWQFVDLNDIGLSPLPDQGVNFKVLLTSRDRQICSNMGVEVDSILNVDLLTEAEAQRLFRQFSGIVDHELHRIGEDIVRKCRGLPIAIKTMACTLKNRGKDAWKDALSRLEHHDVDTIVNEVFELSYDNLQLEETKSVFLLCGLFPEDSNIPTEYLVRYGWGLRLFKRVYNITEARTRLNTCIERLIHTNLLMDSDDVGCVKMHDLVLAFVLDMFSKVEHASVVDHGSMLGWPENDISESFCKKISFTCKGMSKFPGGLKFPNLSLLKLMHGNKSMMFPQDFYREMENLQVISYDTMKCRLPPLSPQCSTSLRVLHLHECSLSFDCSSIGNLLNLEILSFANSCIEWLPSTIGNLKKLRLLDLTNCYGLRIDNGVLKELVNLEELYMRAIDRDGKELSFTDDNCNEMVERLENLFALEFEFFNNNVQPKNMCFGKLQRFKISMGRSFSENFGYLSENSLQLKGNKGEILQSKIYELFEKTEVLCLSVGDMNDLEDVHVKSSSHPHQSFSFHNLRVLVVSECSELKYLFTLGVANTLSKLEHLQVSICFNMEEPIHTGGSGEDKITFPKLKFLSLLSLPSLKGLCDNVNVIELPQLLELELEDIPGFTSIYPASKLETSSFLQEEVVIPKLEKLCIDGMKNLKKIWACGFGTSEEVNVSTLRKIKVKNCDSLVNLFPCNPMPLIRHLEQLEVDRCDSIEVLFDIDLDRVGEIGEGSSNSSLRSIIVSTSKMLREVWGIKGADNSGILVRGFQAVENIRIMGCGRFKNIFTSVTKSLYLGALLEISIEDCGENWRNDSSQEPIKILSEEEETSEFSQAGGVSWSLCQFAREIDICECDALSSVIPCYAAGQMQKIQVLRVRYCLGMKEVFETHNSNNSGSGDGNGCTPAAIPRLNNSAMLQLANLKILEITGCDCLEHISTFSALESLRQLQELVIRDCKAMTVIMKKEDGEAPKAVVFPRLKSILLSNLPELVGFFLGMNEFHWPSLDKINILSQEEDTSNNDDSMSNVVVPSSIIHSFPNLRELDLRKCKRVEVVFKIESPISREFATTQENQQLLPYLETLIIRKMQSLHHIWKCNWNEFLILQKQQSESSFHNLATICLINCKNIKYLFSPLMAKLFSNLKKVEIKKCDGIEEVVSNRDDEDEDEENTAFTSTSAHTSTTLFPCLDSLVLTFLPNLKYIGGGGRANIANNETSFSNSTTSTTIVDPVKNSQAGGVSWTLCQFAREIEIEYCDALSSVIPCYAAGQMQKIQVLRVRYCLGMKEVFETHNSNNSGTSGDGNGCTPAAIPRLNNSAMLQLANLKILQITDCDCLEHISTFSALESLRQLQELDIRDCKAMTVIMKKEDGEAPKAVVFPRLRSIYLDSLPELVGFFLGMNEFSWPSLDKVEIFYCPKMIVFAPGGSTTPKLKFVHTSLGKYSLDQCGLNFHVTTTAHPHHQNPFPSLDGASSSVVTSGGTPWSFHNLIEVDVKFDYSIKKIVPSNELVQLQKLEKICLWYCDRVEGIFEALEAGTDSTGSQATVVKLPNLTQVNVLRLPKLRCIWKSNQWTVFVFPNLTSLCIDGCKSLQHVFTNSMLGSLLQLQELHISNCDSMKEVIVKDSKGVVEEEDEKEEEEGDETEEENEEEDEKEEEDETEEEEDEKEEEDEEDDETEEEEDETEEEESDCEISEITLPRLKSLKLVKLGCLKGFCLGKKDFSFPLLDTLRIATCPSITTFTNGNVVTPQLKEIEISRGSFYDRRGKDINSFIKLNQEEIKKKMIPVPIPFTKCLTETLLIVKDLRDACCNCTWGDNWRR